MGMFSRRWALAFVVVLAHTLPGRLPAADCAIPPCRWAGIYPTVVTPFCCTGGIDEPALEKQIQFQLRGGVHGVLLLGTIGEGQYVDAVERATVIATAARVVKGTVPIVVGIHTSDLAEAQAQTVQAKQLGAAAVLVKYVGNPQASGEEVLGFFHALAELQILPIFYYHYPSDTGLRLSAYDVAAILSLPGVVGIKESTLNLREVEAHIKLTCGMGKVFLSGTALNLTQFMDLGGHGAMSPEACLMPGPVVQAYVAYVKGNRDVARNYQLEFFEVIPILKERGSPALTRQVFMCAQDHKIGLPMGRDSSSARIKYALNLMGIKMTPLVKCGAQLTERDQRRVQRAVARIHEIDWCYCSMQVPPIPFCRCCCCEAEGGMFLRTGALDLGQGAGKNLTSSQSDGLGGFFYYMGR
jgi:4-hydroxy-tetrahydrodipicolinate synthase